MPKKKGKGEMGLQCVRLVKTSGCLLCSLDVYMAYKVGTILLMGTGHLPTSVFESSMMCDVLYVDRPKARIIYFDGIRAGRNMHFVREGLNGRRVFKIYKS